jgi:MFS family permease
VLDGLRSSWREPGTRLGFFTHMGTQFSGTVFGLLWGVPYLVAGQGVGQGTASALLTLLVGVGIVAGPVFGTFTARHPFRRSYLVIGVIVLTAAMWTIVLLIPPPAPLWLLVVLVVVLALGPPGSMVGFDYARTFNPSRRQGTAVGIVNVGGFSASLVLALVIGLVLGALGGYTPAAFRAAWAVQYALWAIALVGIVVMRARARRNLREAGTDVPTLRRYVRERRART